jgi:hypothetical protein
LIGESEHEVTVADVLDHGDMWWKAGLDAGQHGKDRGAQLRAPCYSGLRSTLALTAYVVLLESLQGPSLRDALIDVRSAGILNGLAGHLAGKHERKSVATLWSLLLTLGSNGSSTLSLSLRGLSVLGIDSIGIGIHVI